MYTIGSLDEDIKINMGSTPKELNYTYFIQNYNDTYSLCCEVIIRDNYDLVFLDSIIIEPNTNVSSSINLSNTPKGDLEIIFSIPKNHCYLDNSLLTFEFTYSITYRGKIDDEISEDTNRNDNNLLSNNLVLFLYVIGLSIISVLTIGIIVLWRITHEKFE